MLQASEVSKEECAEAYERSQEHRAAGDLRGSREALGICARAACPTFVQSDCGNWLVEVEAEMPTIVIAAKTATGGDAMDVRVEVDGALVLDGLDGKAIELNPGKRRLRFEHVGVPALERELVIRQGEKNRLVEVVFPPDPLTEALESSPYATTVALEPGAAGEGALEPGPLRPYAFVAGGVGVLGLAGFAVLGILGKREESRLAGECGRTQTCDPLDVDAAKRTLVMADVAGLVGVVGVSSAVALWFLSEPSGPKQPAGGMTYDLALTPGSAMATLRGAF
jgi:hypothetical protein